MSQEPHTAAEEVPTLAVWDGEMRPPEALGFLLTLAKGQAFLSLEGVPFCDGIEIRRAVFDVPDVKFPLEVTGGLSRFRQSQLKARGVEIVLEPHKLVSHEALTQHAFSSGRAQVRAGKIEILADDMMSGRPVRARAGFIGDEDGGCELFVEEVFPAHGVMRANEELASSLLGVFVVPGAGDSEGYRRPMSLVGELLPELLTRAEWPKPRTDGLKLQDVSLENEHALVLRFWGELAPEGWTLRTNLIETTEPAKPPPVNTERLVANQATTPRLDVAALMQAAADEERAGNVDEALRLLRQRIELGGDEEALVACFRKVARLEYDKRAALLPASLALEALLRLSPEDLDASTELLRIAEERQDWERMATELRRRALLLPPGPGQTAVWLSLGDLLAGELSRGLEAERVWLRALSSTRSDAPLQRLLARAQDGNRHRLRIRIHLASARARIGTFAAAQDAAEAGALLAGILDRPRLALAAFRFAVAQGQDPVPALRAMVEIHRALGDSVAALQESQHLLERTEGVARALVHEVRADLRETLLDDAAGAAEERREALRLDPAARMSAYNLEKWLRAGGQELEAIEVRMALADASESAAQRAQTYAHLAMRAEDELGDLELATHLAQEALRADPQLGSVRLRRANCLEKLGRVEQAATELGWLVQHGYDNLAERVAMARRKARLEKEFLGRPESARKTLRTALLLVPNEPTLVDELVGLEEELGETATAAQIFEEFIRTEPGQDAQLGTRGQMLERLARLLDGAGDSRGALDRLLEASVLGDLTRAGELRLARLAEQLGRPDLVVASLDRLLESGKSPAEERLALFGRLGVAAEKCGETERAVRAWRSRLALAPQDSEAIAALGRLEKSMAVGLSTQSASAVAAPSEPEAKPALGRRLDSLEEMGADLRTSTPAPSRTLDDAGPIPGESKNERLGRVDVLLDLAGKESTPARAEQLREQAASLMMVEDVDPSDLLGRFSALRLALALPTQRRDDALRLLRDAEADAVVVELLETSLPLVDATTRRVLRLELVAVLREGLEDHERAATHLESHVRETPEDREAWGEFLECLDDIGHAERQIDALKQRIELTGGMERRELVKRWAGLLVEQGRAEECESLIQALCVEWPQDAALQELLTQVREVADAPVPAPPPLVEGADVAVPSAVEMPANAQQIYELQAVRARTQGNVDGLIEALAKLEPFTVDIPARVANIVERAQLLRTRKKSPQEAMAVLDRGIADLGERISFLVERGRCLHGLGDSKQGGESLLRAAAVIKSPQKQVLLRKEAAACLASASEMSRAMQIYIENATVYDDAPSLVDAEKIARGVEQYEALTHILEMRQARASTQDDVRVLAMERATLMKEHLGNGPGAMQVLEDLAIADPGDLASRLTLARWYRSEQRLLDAALAYASAAGISHLAPEVLAPAAREAASLLYSLDDLERAGPLADQAIDGGLLEDESVQVSLEWHRQRGNWQQVDARLGQCIELQSDKRRMARLWLERSQVRAERLNDFTGAEEARRRATTLNEEVDDALRKRHADV